MIRLSGDLKLLMLFRAARSITAGMISLAFPYLVLRTLHYPAYVLGIIYTAAAIATAVLGLAFAFLADLRGRRLALTVAGGLLPVSCLLLYISEALPVIFAAAVIGGFSATGSLTGGGIGGAAAPVQSALITELTRAETRTSYFAVFTFATGLFGALGVLITRALEIREVFLLGFLLSGVGTLLLFGIRAGAPAHREAGLHSRGMIGRFTVTGALNGFAQGLVTPFLVPFFIIAYEVPRSSMSTYGFISGMLGAVALLAAPLLERRWGFVKSIAITRGTGAVLLAFMPLSPMLALALLIYFLTPALRVIALPVQQTALTERVDEGEVGRALGINQVARLAASAAAMSLTGYLFHVRSLGLPFYLYAAIMLVNVALYFRFFGTSPDAVRPNNEEH